MFKKYIKTTAKWILLCAFSLIFLSGLIFPSPVEGSTIDILQTAAVRLYLVLALLMVFVNLIESYYMIPKQPELVLKHVDVYDNETYERAKKIMNAEGFNARARKDIFSFNSEQYGHFATHKSLVIFLCALLGGFYWCAFFALAVWLSRGVVLIERESALKDMIETWEKWGIKTKMMSQLENKSEQTGLVEIKA